MNIRVNQMQGRNFFLAHQPNFFILPFAFLLLPSEKSGEKAEGKRKKAEVYLSFARLMNIRVN
jgi:hypothetical protein